MFIQNLTRSKNRYTFILSLPPILPINGKPIAANSRDYGFDFDDEELAQQLLAPVPASRLDRPNLTIEAEEFDLLYRWFSS